VPGVADSFRAWQHKASDGLSALLSLWAAGALAPVLAETAQGFSPDLTRRIAVLRFSASGHRGQPKARLVPPNKPSLLHPVARESIVNLVGRDQTGSP